MKQIARCICTFFAAILLCTGMLGCAAPMITEPLSTTQPLSSVYSMAEKPYPENGFVLFEDSERNVPITIQTNDALYFYLKFKRINTNSTDMAIFVHSGSKIKTSVPLGMFRLQYACGQKWYGEKDCFGPDTAYGEFEEDFLFEKDYTYTLELIGQIDGNLHNKVIDPDEFRS